MYAYMCVRHANMGIALKCFAVYGLLICQTACDLTSSRWKSLDPWMSCQTIFRRRRKLTLTHINEGEGQSPRSMMEGERYRRGARHP